MAQHTFYTFLEKELDQIKQQGLFKQEHPISSSQSAHVTISNQSIINLCANNYLGLANHETLIKTCQDSVKQWGFGCASVRFICGTQSIHKKLESKISSFLHTDDTILYSSCFDANGGLFETLLSDQDAIISDELNHASIIDGIRLSKAKRYRYKNRNMTDLEEKLKEAKTCRFKLIATDAVFSMDGYIAPLDKIVSLAKQYDALVMMDDCHGIGVIGKQGKGASEHYNLLGEIDIITGTLGKALGGASGGFTTGKKVLIDYLRQRSRPYLFSNSLAPMITASSIKAIDLLTENPTLITHLHENTTFFRQTLTEYGFDIIPGTHAIIPIMLYDETLATTMAAELMKKGIYVVGFSYPVVPKQKARIRVQMSSQFTRKELETIALEFKLVGKALNII